MTKFVIGVIVGLLLAEFNIMSEMLNFFVESGLNDVTIETLSILIKKVVGYEGKLTFDHSKPDGTPRKLLDVNVLSNLGWRSNTTLHKGLKLTYDHYLQFLQN